MSRLILIMQKIEVAKLVLHTCILNSGEYNKHGYCNEHRSNYTFTNVDLKLLMGDMYDKYELFNLQLVSLLTEDNNAYDISGGMILRILNQPGITQSDRYLNINMKGLNVINGTYDTQTRMNTSTAVIGSFKLSSLFTAYDNNVVTFAKGSNMINLNLFYTTVFNNDAPNTYLEYPDVTYIFNIYGVKANDED